MIKRLKYQNGGEVSKQEELVQLFQAAAENAQVDPQELVQKASEIGQDEEAAAQFMQGLQLCAQGDPEGIRFIKSLFQSPAFKEGGKIWDFICKHKKGGYVAGCGCGKKIPRGEDGLPLKPSRNQAQEGVPEIRQPYDRTNYFFNDSPLIYGRISDEFIGSPTEMSHQPIYDPQTGKLVDYIDYTKPEDNYDSPTSYKTVQGIYNRSGRIGHRYSNGREGNRKLPNWSLINGQLIPGGEYE